MNKLSKVACQNKLGYRPRKFTYTNVYPMYPYTNNSIKISMDDGLISETLRPSIRYIAECSVEDIQEFFFHLHQWPEYNIKIGTFRSKQFLFFSWFLVCHSFAMQKAPVSGTIVLLFDFIQSQQPFRWIWVRNTPIVRVTLNGGEYPLLPAKATAILSLVLSSDNQKNWLTFWKYY